MRAAALGIDLVCLAGGPLLLGTGVVFGTLLATPDPPASLPGVYRIAQIAFLALFLARDRWLSPGKRLLGLRAVGRGGAPTTLLESVVRNLPLLVPGWNLLEAFLVLGRKDGVRTGDRLAGTVLHELS